MRIAPLVITSLLASAQCHADWSSTVTLSSDYLFNGVTQTDEKPALQASLDWANEQGWYAGTWASNVDFNDSTNAEVDVYVGYATDLTQDLSLDAGLVYYSYHGASYSSDINYGEIYSHLNWHNTQISLWYAWDYVNLDASHYIVALSQTFPVSELMAVELGVDRSTSLDKDKFTWEGDDKNYTHWYVRTHLAFEAFDVTVGVEGTDLDTYGDTRLAASISKSFEL